MAEETLLTAARRLIRNVRVDDAAHGGLMSRETVVAADLLEKQALLAEKWLAAQQAAPAAKPKSNVLPL